MFLLKWFPANEDQWSDPGSSGLHYLGMRISPNLHGRVQICFTLNYRMDADNDGLQKKTCFLQLWIF